MEVDVNGETIPQETDALMLQPISNGVKPGAVMVNSNGFVMSASGPGQSPVVVADRTSSIGTPSQKSTRSGGTGSTRSAPDILRYNRTKLQTIGVLGKGMFGDVFLAKAPVLLAENDDQLVFVKSLLNRDENIQVEFRLEVEMYNKLNHDRICKLLALCKEKEPIYMVMEYCEWGDLKQFLLATSKDNRQQLTIEPPDTTQKLRMCCQVAEAMEYLSSQRFIHRDVASRNILLEPNLSVKLANLSLCRDIYASEYVQAPNGHLVPLRWTSPEAWLEEDYSTKSDIWSYGCFLFEVFSGAEIPYSDLTNKEVIDGLKSGDLEPSVSNQMPEQIRAIACQCWSSNPNDRPDFKQVNTMFSGILIDTQL